MGNEIAINKMRKKFSVILNNFTGISFSCYDIVLSKFLILFEILSSVIKSK